MLPQPTALVDKRACQAFFELPFAIKQRTLARRAPVCQESCTSASTDALERRARSTASRKSRHCMIHGKPTYMRTWWPAARARSVEPKLRPFHENSIGSYYTPNLNQLLQFQDRKAAREMTVNRFTGPPRFPQVVKRN